MEMICIIYHLGNKRTQSFHHDHPLFSPGLILRLKSPAKFISEASKLSPLISFSDLTLLLGASTKGLPAAGVGTGAA